MIVAVFADTTDGITDASITRNRSTPRTRSSGSTTDRGSLPLADLGRVGEHVDAVLPKHLRRAGAGELLSPVWRVYRASI